MYLRGVRCCVYRTVLLYLNAQFHLCVRVCVWIRSHRFHVNRDVYDWTDERSLVRPFDESPCNAFIRNCDRWLENNGAFYVNVKRLGLWIFYSRRHCHSHLLSIFVIHFLCFTLLLFHCRPIPHSPSIAIFLLDSPAILLFQWNHAALAYFFVSPTDRPPARPPARPANWIKTKLDECVSMCALIHICIVIWWKASTNAKNWKKFGMKGIRKIPIGVIDEVILSLHHRTYK